MAATERPDDDKSDPTPVVVAEYGTYSGAQAALDRLTAHGLPHGSVSLVWSRLRQIEPSSAARARASAVVEGAVGGASAGGLAAILLSLFVELQDGMSVVAFVGSWTLAFATLGAMARGVVAQRGRDHRLGAGAELAAEGYQLWVDEGLAPRASAILGTQAPAEQPPPSAPAGGRPAAQGPGRVPSGPAIHATAATLLGAPARPESAGGPVDPRPGTA